LKYTLHRPIYENLQLYRAADNYETGTFVWYNFIATTTSLEVALSWGKKCLYCISLEQCRERAGFEYADITEYSMFPEERELLLTPGLEFKVVLDKSTRMKTGLDKICKENGIKHVIELFCVSTLYERTI